jgi:hypothetical protein
MCRLLCLQLVDCLTAMECLQAQKFAGRFAIANLLGVPWYANELVPKQGKSGYGMPQGGDLNNNYVDPRVYGYISPILNPAMYQGARSSSK